MKYLYVNCPYISGHMGKSKGHKLFTTARKDSTAGKRFSVSVGEGQESSASVDDWSDVAESNWQLVPSGGTVRENNGINHHPRTLIAGHTYSSITAAAPVPCSVPKTCPSCHGSITEASQNKSSELSFTGHSSITAAPVPCSTSQRRPRCL